MSLFQLPVAVALASSAFLSLLSFRGLSGSKQIALPVTPDGPWEQPRRDPFDVTSPEDIIDGEPIDENGFWVHVCFVIRIQRSSVSFFLDEATRDTPCHCFRYYHISTRCLLGLCGVSFLLDGHSHLPSPRTPCHLSRRSRSPVHS